MRFLFSGLPTRGIQVCTILVSPGKILQVLGPIRQHIVFNELIRSCTRPLEPSGALGVLIEVSFDALCHIRLLLTLPNHTETTTVLIHVENGGQINVATDKKDPALDSLLTRALQASQHIPLSIQHYLDHVRHQ